MAIRMPISLVRSVTHCALTAYIPSPARSRAAAARISRRSVRERLVIWSCNEPPGVSDSGSPDPRVMSNAFDAGSRRSHMDTLVRPCENRAAGIRPLATNQRRTRLIIDVPDSARRRVRTAAARRAQSIRQFVWEAVEARLNED